MATSPVHDASPRWHRWVTTRLSGGDGPRREAARARRDRRRFAALQHYRTLRALGLVGTAEREVERAIDDTGATG